MMTTSFKDIFPFDGIPVRQDFKSMRLNWYNSDKMELFIKNKSKYNLEERDILYEFNSYGYRCPEFEINDFNVLSIGCSIIEGIGIHYEETCSYLLCKKLEEYMGKSVSNWNLSCAGKSNDYISRVLLQSLNTLKPNLVIVHFTYITRLEWYVLDENTNLKTKDIFLYTKNKKHNNPLNNLLSEFYTELDVYSNFFNNYQRVFSTLQALNINWLYSHVLPNNSSFILPNHEIFSLNNVTKTENDLARDRIHKGANSNKVYSEYLFLEIQKRNLLQ